MENNVFCLTGKALLISAAICLSIMATAGASAATYCAEPSGAGGCQTTIQAAINLATTAGDVVEVKSGAYFENITIVNSDIILKGAGRTIIDPDEPDNTGPAITIGANNVTVTAITIRYGKAQGILINNSVTGTKVDKVTFKNIGVSGGGTNHCIYAGSGNTNTRVINSSFQSCNNYAIYIAGDDVTIDSNKFTNTNDVAVWISGNNVKVSKNIITDFYSDAVWVTGNNAEISNNKFTNGNGRAISFDSLSPPILAPIAFNNVITGANGSIYVSANSSGANIEDNKIFDTGDGIRFVGTATTPSIIHNRLVSIYSGNDAIYLSTATTPIISRNYIKLAQSGISITTDAQAPQISKNTIEKTQDWGVYIKDCTASCSDGFIKLNSIKSIAGTGIYLKASAEGLTTSDNQIKDVVNYGLDLDGVGLIVKSNHITQAGSTITDACIQASGVAHKIQENILKNCQRQGIRLDGITLGPIVSFNTISGSTGHGISIVDNNSADVNGYLLEGNKISKVDGYGIRLDKDITDVTLWDNVVSSTGREALCQAGLGFDDTTFGVNTYGSTPPSYIPGTGIDCPLQR